MKGPPLTPAKLTSLLLKARKGATASFGAAQWFQVFEAIGWKSWFEKNADRAIVKFTVEIPGEKTKVLVYNKPNNCIRMTFYRGTLDGAEVNGIDSALKALPEWTTALAKVLGEEKPKEEFRRPNAPTCPVCFGDYLLDSKKRMVHHGYSRPGYGFIVGDCFGVDYEPWEVSPMGAVDFVSKRLVPALADLKEKLIALESGKVTSFTRKDWKWIDGKRTEVEIKVTDEYPYHEEFAWRTAAAIEGKKSAIAETEATIANYRKLIGEWQPKPLPEFIGNIPVLHHEAVRPGREEKRARCVRWQMRAKYLPKTADISKVTCKKCLKLIEQGVTAQQT